MRGLRCKLSLFLFVISLLSVFLFSSCAIKGFAPGPGAKSKGEPKRIYLRHWSYSVDGNDFISLPNAPLDDLEKLIPGGKGFLTLHTEFTIPWQLMSGDVGLALGKILVASKVYVNGKEVGGSGVFPPEAFAGGQAYTNIKLDPQNLKMDSENTLELVLWVEGKGGISDRPFISTYEETYHFTNAMSFFYSKLNLIFSWSMVLCGIAYLMFFIQQKKERQYYDYALMSLWTSAYLIPFWLSEIPNMIGAVPYLWWIKIFNGTVSIVVCYYATSFIRSFLGEETPKKMRFMRIAVMWGGIIYTLCIPSVLFFYKYILILAFILFVELLFGFSAIVNEYRKENDNLKKLLAGFSPVIISVGADIVLKLVLKLSMVPMMSLYGWQMTAFTFIALVTNRYAKIRNQFEYLNENLEREVKDRTEKLSSVNEELSRRQEQAEQDMALAVHVQKSFYPQSTDFLGWDVAVSFNPCSGVSGDLYDFYVLKGQLRGFGLFDVSGHGISSGLVTMLVKNTIFNEFVTSLPLPLSEAIKIINDQVIQIKGDIENYLTGCLFRIDKKDPYSLEFVNAGGPHPVYKKKGKSKKAELLKPNEKKPHYGMLGVKDLDVEFQTIKKKIKAGDSIILYTDGLTETENENGDPYGKERLLMAVDKASGTAQQIVDAIMRDVNRFAGKHPIEDDITLIVLRRTDDSEESEEETLDVTVEDYGTLEEL